MELLLASKSPRRRELLSDAGYTFRILVSEADETLPANTPPAEGVKILAERKARNFTTFDARPCFGASLDDIDLDLFQHDYLPKAVDAAILASDDRPIERKMESLEDLKAQLARDLQAVKACPQLKPLIVNC